MNKRYTITETATRIGVTPKTIVRWEKAGKIKGSKRDWRGWRSYSEDEVKELEQLVNTVYEPSRKGD